MRRNQMVVDLQNLLDRAKSGELKSLAFIAFTREHMFYRVMSDGQRSQLEMLGAFRRLELHIDDMMYEDEMEEPDLMPVVDPTTTVN